MEETFKLVRDKLSRLEVMRQLGGGVVLTGGAALLPGAVDLATEVFQLPVRIGSPLACGGLVEDYRSPEFATAVGLLIEGFEREGGAGAEAGNESRRTEKRREPVFGNVFSWLKKEFF
jgi:cell division protein FtsA